jgi:hypothetical protein
MRAVNKTNFDLFLEGQLRDPDFARRFQQAAEVWDFAMKADRREKTGLFRKANYKVRKKV